MEPLDVPLAREIAEGTDRLNDLLGSAWLAGLRIDVEVEQVGELGRFEPRSVVSVRVYRPL
jgi:hypothetical protein